MYNYGKLIWLPKKYYIINISDRVVPAEHVNEGKQIPIRKHPVFIAQYATAICCRGYIEKWHKFSQNRKLPQPEQKYLVAIIIL